MVAEWDVDTRCMRLTSRQARLRRRAADPCRPRLPRSVGSRSMSLFVTPRIERVTLIACTSLGQNSRDKGAKPSHTESASFKAPSQKPSIALALLRFTRRLIGFDGLRDSAVEYCRTIR